MLSIEKDAIIALLDPFGLLLVAEPAKHLLKTVQFAMEVDVFSVNSLIFLTQIDVF